MATINGSGNDDILEGSEGADTINAHGGDDTVYGFAGNDTINGHGGNDTLYGGEGDDTLKGMNGNDTLYGEAGNDSLDGGNDDDRLTGGEGDDTLTGGNGRDSFHYSFAVSEGGGENFSTWLCNQGHGAAIGSDGELLDGTGQGFFSSQYSTWLLHLVDQYGLNPDGLEVDIHLDQNDPDGAPQAWIDGVNVLAGMFGERADFSYTSGGGKGAVTHTRYYSDEFTFGGGLSASSRDGHDTITDFKRGEDILDFSGLTQEHFAQLFSVTQMDVNADGKADTVLTLDSDPGWSLTLLGVSDFSTDDILFS